MIMWTSRVTVPMALAAVAAMTASAQNQAQAFPFRAVSVTEQGRITDAVEGIAEVRERDIRVVIRSGLMQLTPSIGSRPQAFRAVLAAGDTARWRQRAQSPKVRASAIRARGDTLIDSVEFVIPRPRSLDLAQHWIAILVEAEVNVPDRGWVAGGFRPVHADPKMFVPSSRP